MIIISELNYLNDSKESNINISTIVGGFGRRTFIVNQETVALSNAKAINGDATAIANAEGTFSYSPSRYRRSRFGR